MKTTRFLLSLTTVFALSSVMSPEAAAQGPVKVNLKKLDVIVQTSPKYDVQFVTEKRISRNKKWLEFEVEFEAIKAPVAGDPSPFIDGLLFKYYVAFKYKDPTTGKNIMATGQVDHINVEPSEETHSVMYVSPASVARIRNKIGEATKTDIEGFAVQVLYQGQVVAEDATFSKSSRWWATGVLPPKDGFLVPKSDTPFAPLWYDYHAEVRPAR